MCIIKLCAQTGLYAHWNFLATMRRTQDAHNKHFNIMYINRITIVVLTWAVGSVWRVRRLPHAVVGAEVAVHCILSEAVAVLTVKSTVNTFLFFKADELSVHWNIWLVAGRPWTNTTITPFICWSTMWNNTIIQTLLFNIIWRVCKKSMD